MLQPVAGAPPVSFVSHDLGKPQSSQYMADPRQRPIDRLGDRAGAHLAVAGQGLNDCEGHRVPQQAAEP
jgi:hypothetical protein